MIGADPDFSTLAVVQTFFFGLYAMIGGVIAVRAQFVDCCFHVDDEVIPFPNWLIVLIRILLGVFWAPALVLAALNAFGKYVQLKDWR